MITTVNECNFFTFLNCFPSSTSCFFPKGISQAAVDCFVPDVLVRRNFLNFVTDEIDVLFPADEYHRLIAHPPSVSIDSVPVRFNQLQRGTKDEENDRSSIESKIEKGNENENESENENEKRNKMKIPKKILVAVGPEGGWEDDEVNQLLSKGFFLASLGPRILRTDMAVSVLLGLAHDWTDNIE